MHCIITKYLSECIKYKREFTLLSSIPFLLKTVLDLTDKKVIITVALVSQSYVS